MFNHPSTDHHRETKLEDLKIGSIFGLVLAYSCHNKQELFKIRAVSFKKLGGGYEKYIKQISHFVNLYLNSFCTTESSEEFSHRIKKGRPSRRRRLNRLEYRRRNAVCERAAAH